MVEHRPAWAITALALSVALTAPARARGTPESDAGALVTAITLDDVAGAKAALAQGIDPNQPIAFGATPLTLAVNGQNAGMVDLLLAHGAIPDAADIDGVSPLTLGCELGDPLIVAHLLDAKPDVTAARPDGATPLAICARFGPAGAVARILATGAAADTIDNRGQTPLMWAAAGGRDDAIALLLRAGADPNRVSRGGFTPLFFAIKSGSVSAVQALLSAGAKADYRGPERTSAAQLAMYQHNYRAAALFVARGADLTERDRTGEQLLHAAAAAGDALLVAALLPKGADPNALTGPSTIKWVTEANFGVPPPPVPPTPPLLIAAANGRSPVMRLLVAAGANPGFVAADGTTVLLAAARGGDAAALDLALRLAPDVNVANARGDTALHLLLGGGVQPGLQPMLAILAAHHARTDLANKAGTTAAAMAEGGLTEVRAIFDSCFPTTKPVTIAARGH